MSHLANVHVEHLPVGRYGAIPDADPRPEVGLSIDRNAGHTKLTHSNHHLIHRHAYRSVDQVRFSIHLLSIEIQVVPDPFWFFNVNSLSSGSIQHRDIQLLRVCTLRNSFCRSIVCVRSRCTPLRSTVVLPPSICHVIFRCRR